MPAISSPAPTGLIAAAATVAIAPTVPRVTAPVALIRLVSVILESSFSFVSAISMSAALFSGDRAAKA
jgi:hypothetical protein